MKLNTCYSVTSILRDGSFGQLLLFKHYKDAKAHINKIKKLRLDKVLGIVELKISKREIQVL